MILWHNTKYAILIWAIEVFISNPSKLCNLVLAVWGGFIGDHNSLISQAELASGLTIAITITSYLLRYWPPDTVNTITHLYLNIETLFFCLPRGSVFVLPLIPSADSFIQTLVDSCSLLKTPADFSCLLQTPSVICRLLQSPVADSRSVPPGLLAEIVLPGRFWTNIFQEVRKSLSDPRWVEHH